MTPDETGDTNLRYSGANPNNYVFFNCSDYNNQSTSTCETWRIIGIFNVSNGTITEPRIKIIRDALPTSYSWDSSPTDKNEGKGYNVWETISGQTKADGTTKADVNILLNEYYYKRENTNHTCYKERYSETEAAQVPCNFATNGLRDGTTKDLIEDAIWNIGGGTYSINNPPYPLLTINEYNAERGTTVYWSSIAKTRWKGKVALPHASDYGYASTDSECKTDLRSGVTWNGSINNYTKSKCKNTNWLYNGLSYWTISHNSVSSYHVFRVHDGGAITDNVAYCAFGIRPTVYLKANVKITGTNTGTSLLPYKLSL